MKKFLIIVLALLFPVSVFAAENLQQKRHGGAVWVQNKDGTTHPAGGVLVVDMTDLINATTKHVMAFKTGNIMKVYSVLQGAITGNAGITVKSNNPLTIGSEAPFTNTGHTLTITASGSAAGVTDSSVFTSPTTATRVQQGDVIAIVGDGTPSAQTGGATFIIVIE